MKYCHTPAAMLFAILMLHSCSEEGVLSGDKVSGDSPILLSADRVTPFTRSYVPQGMHDNFKVYAVSEHGGERTTAIDGYEVKFKGDEWNYVTDTQHLIYWNSNADRYLFTAGAPISAVTAISETSMTLRLTNNNTASAMASEPLSVKQDSPDFGKLVKLRFAYAHSMVRVAFTKTATTDVTITDITLTPDAPIATEANMTYSYDWSTTPAQATTQLTTTATSASPLVYDEVTIPSNTTSVTLSETHHYCVPSAANPTGWTVTLTCDGETKSASFANDHTWESGKSYTYIFSLTDKTPKLVSVVTQDLQDAYFDCNDILPGGDFTDTDMTE